MRRLAKLAKAPFLKVEATKFTEVGYVGRDVESIVRDLVEIAVSLVRDQQREALTPAAQKAAEERVITALVGDTASPSTRESFRKKLRSGELDDKEVEIEISDSASSVPMMELPGQAGGPGMMNLGELLGKAFQMPPKKKRMTVAQSHEVLLVDEADRLIDQEEIVRTAIHAVEQTGIVFLDEIDKVAAKSENRSGDVSREGVQRDLLPLIEGTTVATKHGPVKTDHILFIASGAFHVAKPSDLLPELQGRLPIRVELTPLTETDFVRILSEPQASLVDQSIALMATENITLAISDDAIAEMAKIAAQMNSAIENIGARRLHTIVERVLSELSFDAPDRIGEDRKVTIDADYVRQQLSDIAQDQDLSRYIL